MLTAKEWGRIWDNIYDKYGSCLIYVSGGEPAIYPYFYDLVRILSKRHTLDICTNLSWEVKTIIPEISSQGLKVSATFHPSFANFEEFFAKAIEIKDYLSNSQIFYVAYSEQIKEIPERSKRLKENGINLIPLPLRGKGVVLNTEAEKKIVEELTPYSGEKKDYQLQRISPKGKLCYAGQYYAVIRANGKVDRCSQYENGSVGNFMNLDFKLAEKPLPCDKEYCPIESQWIVNKLETFS